MAILMLIKPWMKRARSFRRMRNVFLKEPFLLYIMDIKRAVLHLLNGCNFSDFPETSNWKIKVDKDLPEKEPYWKPLQFRRDSQVTKLRTDSLHLNSEDLNNPKKLHVAVSKVF